MIDVYFNIKAIRIYFELTMALYDRGYQATDIKPETTVTFEEIVSTQLILTVIISFFYYAFIFWPPPLVAASNSTPSVTLTGLGNLHNMRNKLISPLFHSNGLALIPVFNLRSFRKPLKEFLCLSKRNSNHLDGHFRQTDVMVLF